MFGSLFSPSKKPVPARLASQARSTGLRIDRDAATIRRAPMMSDNTVPREPIPIAGTRVEFVNADSRFTLTRFALAGPFALALKKHTNYLVFTTPDEMEYMVKVFGLNATQARQWAMEFNNLSRSLSRETTTGP